jgi:molybdopterin molybdotransferase
MLRVMLGGAAVPSPRLTARLGHDIAKNGPREHYMRAALQDGVATVFDRQDSSLLGVLSQANALAVRPPNDPARKAGDTLEFILL